MHDFPMDAPPKISPLAATYSCSANERPIRHGIWSWQPDRYHAGTPSQVFFAPSSLISILASTEEERTAIDMRRTFFARAPGSGHRQPCYAYVCQKVVRVRVRGSGREDANAGGGAHSPAAVPPTGPGGAENQAYPSTPSTSRFPKSADIDEPIRGNIELL